MTLIILGLDGLDYDLVEKLNLENLKQRQYARLKVPINKNLKMPHSPEVWASFLCGKHVDTTFIGTRNFWMKKPLMKLKSLFPFISFGIGRKFTGTINGFPELNERSWAESNSVLKVGVPYFNYTNEVFDYTAEFNQTKDLVEFKRKLYQDYLKKSKKAIQIIQSENLEKYKIVFVYLHFPDQFNHVCYQEKERVEALYKIIDKFARKFSSLVKKHHLLIISDHGADFKHGWHSQTGFISSNKETKLPKDIIVFGSKIYRLVEDKKQ